MRMERAAILGERQVGSRPASFGPMERRQFRAVAMYSIGVKRLKAWIGVEPGDRGGRQRLRHPSYRARGPSPWRRSQAVSAVASPRDT
jgi:hypothetical protein